MITNKFRSINFLNQTGNFDYIIDLSINNNTGYFEFGLSGNKNLTFKGQYGKIKDVNDNVIIGYSPNQEFKVSGSIYSGKESLSFNQGFLAYSNISNTGYNFNHFYVDTIDCAINYNFNLIGEPTDFSTIVPTPKIKDYNIKIDAQDTPYTTQILTGKIINQNPNVEIRIFSGTVLDKTTSYDLYGFPITFYDTGTYFINTSTGIDVSVNDSFRALFYTNFGNIEKTITISGEIIPLFFLFFNVSPGISGFPNIQTGFDIISINSPENYSVNYGFVSGANVQVSLDYVSGLTGDVTGFFPATGKFTGILTGLLVGSGFLSNYVATGITFSGRNDFSDKIEFVTNSGFYAQKFKIATGYSQGNYVLTGYGLGSGYIYENIFATGKIKVLLTGEIPYVGGKVVSFNPYPFTGSGIAYNQNNSGFIATGIVDGFFPNVSTLFYTGALTGIVLNDQQYSGKNFTFTPPKDSVVVSSKRYAISATGYETGFGSTGIIDSAFFLNVDQGYYTISKKFTGVRAESKVQDGQDVITGYLGIIQCEISSNRKYIAVTSGLSGYVTGTGFFSLCDSESYLPSGFFVVSKTQEPSSLYLVTGDCEELDRAQLDQSIPKFIVIKPTGEYELEFKNLETGNNYLLNEQQYFASRSGIRTQVFGLGSGYFDNVVGDCTNLGRWEHIFSANEILVEKNVSDYILKQINFDLITLEDDGTNYFSEVKFDVTGKLEKIDLNLKSKNSPINFYQQRDIYYNLLLSKKIVDGYSGFYESKYINIVNDLQFCTGLLIGSYKARVKYVNVSTSPTGTSICRVPIQIVNILDKNSYNQPNIDLFTGSLIYNFDAFRFYGTGWHHQSNIYYHNSSYPYINPPEIYGTQFLKNTGYTENHRLNLFKPSVKNFLGQHSYNNTIVSAINHSVTGLTGWQENAVKNINLITNNISLSGWTKDNFLTYIKNINLNYQIIFNTIDCANTRELDSNFKSFDSTSEFLKDIATAGGGSYYNLASKFEGLVPFTNQPVYVTCNRYYPPSSQPPIDSIIYNPPTVDARPGHTGIEILPPQTIPPQPVLLPSPPAIETPIVVPDIIIPGPIEDAPPNISQPLKPIEPELLIIGGGGASPGTKPSPNPSPKGTCSKRDLKLGLSVTSAAFSPEPKYQKTNNKCRCKKNGTFVIKGTITNPNCIGKNVIITGKVRIRDEFGNTKKTFEGTTTVALLGSGGESVPQEKPSPFDNAKPDPKLSPSLDDYKIPITSSKGLDDYKIPITPSKGLNDYKTSITPSKGLDDYKIIPKVEGLPKTNSNLTPN